MSDILADAALDQLFRTARTQNAFQDRPVEDSQLHALYELLKWGPTAANSTPARFVFVKSAEAKQKLAPALSEGNRAKTLAAPVTVIVGFDLDFHEKLPYLFPHTDAKAWFDGPREGRHEAFQAGDEHERDNGGRELLQLQCKVRRRAAAAECGDVRLHP